MDILVKKENLSFSKAKPDLIYLNADVGSVFDSQVANYLMNLHKTNVFSTITLLCGIKSISEEQRVRAILNDSDIDLIFFKALPNYPVFNLIQSKQIKQALKSIRKSKKTHIHIRGELLAMHAYNPIIRYFGNINNVVVDIRGAGYEELSIYQNTPRWKIYLKKQNYLLAFKSLNNFNKISVVSAALKDYIIGRTRVQEHKIHITPCIAGKSFMYNENDRNRIRKLLQIQDHEIVLVFSSGGNAGWQNMHELKDLSSDRYTILSLSKVKINEKGIISLFVPHTEVHAYLSAADAAIIFRDKNIVNKVACPVKFCEYVCSGLYIFSNPAVDEIYSYVHKFSAGQILNHSSDIQSTNLNKIVQGNRKQQAENGVNTYGIDAITEKYLKIYFLNS